MTSRKPYDIGPPYMVQYHHNGQPCCFKLGADDWDDAQARLRSIGFNGQVIGSGVETMRANVVTLPFVHVWLMLNVWVRNLFRRREP